MKMTREAVIATVIAIIVAYPVSRWVWGEVAERYFKHKCEASAGEFIYKTVENVEGIYQMRLRDPRDYIDRVRKGDIPEDPFGHTNVEAQEPWITFLTRESGEGRYKYFETTRGPNLSHQRLKTVRFENDIEYTGEKYWIYLRAFERRDDAKHNNKIAKQTSQLKSRYGFTWKEIRDWPDELFGIWGGELIVIDMETDDVLAIRRGYIFLATFSDRAGICPHDKNHFVSAKFLEKVLQPTTRDDERE